MHGSSINTTCHASSQDGLGLMRSRHGKDVDIEERMEGRLERAGSKRVTEVAMCACGSLDHRIFRVQCAWRN